MTAVRRWCLVAVGVLLLVATPLAVNAWPAGDTEITARQLLDKVQAADDAAYSGYVEAVGGLSLPTTDEFGAVADLFGGASRLRVWWRSDESWRVDRLAASGETDLFHAGDATTTWDYERLTTTATLDALVFLPRTVELLPPRLARLVLTGARPEEVSRLPAARIAGRTAPGLRLTPSAPQASITRVDLWADAESGLPLRVQVYGDGQGAPPVETSFVQVALDEPAADVVAFEPPPGSQPRFGGVGSDSLLGHIPAAFESRALAGLPRVGGASPAHLFSRYGRGVTQLLVLALDYDVSEPLRDQLASAAGVVVDDLGSALAAGPLHLRLSPHRHYEPSWLLVGTVDDKTLRRAARTVYGADAAPAGMAS